MTEEKNKRTVAEARREHFFKKIVHPFFSFAINFLKIKNKKGGIVPLKLNYGQIKLLKAISELKKQGKPVRIIVLKARQIGFSTLIQAIFFHHNFIKPYQKIATIGHKVDASNNLFEMYRRYYEFLPDHLKPELGKSNEKKVLFKGNGSENVVYTAGSDDSGRSSTLQGLHATEVAFYPGGGQTIMLGLEQATQDADMVFIESTANGIGGYFYDKWQDAVAGKNDYTPVFVAWWEEPSYSKQFTTNYMKSKFIDAMTEDDKNIMERYSLTYEQMYWRRWAIDNLCQGDINKYNQEYPDCPETAFVASGRPVFDVQVCQDNYQKAPGPFRVGYLTADAFGKIKFVDDPHGQWAIYDKDIVYNDGDKYRYAAGVDVAEGLAQGDYTVVKIYDRKDKRVCMRFHGHIDPDLLGDEIKRAQLFLKDDVYFCIESNNHGLTTIVKCFNLNVNLYRRADFSRGCEQDTSKLGFKTSAATKPNVINLLRELIREKEFVDSEKEFWKECLTFVYNDKGSMQAQNKDIDKNTRAYDDRVMSAALMFECDRWLPSYRFEKKIDLPAWAKRKKKKSESTGFMSI
jgi:hypothetical protein